MNNQLENYTSELLEMKITVYSGFKDNTWGADLADMQLIRKFNKGFRFYYVLLIFLVNTLGLFL